ncbi:MAG: PGF-CTERM sorting domain-containing protein [Methanolobus sp.]|nr:PGF-CTERM sorting domain-containing protein [Methanolobus sp.]
MVSATSEALDAFNQRYDTNGTRIDSCTVCHGSNTDSLNPYGTAYSGSGGNFESIEAPDSDGDGFTNLEEIDALTFPGDPSDYPGNTSTPSSGVVSNATERVDNATERVSNATERVENATERVGNATERVENATERVGNATDGQQIPGFEAVLALTGILMAIYLFRRR